MCWGGMAFPYIGGIDTMIKPDVKRWFLIFKKKTFLTNYFCYTITYIVMLSSLLQDYNLCFAGSPCSTFSYYNSNSVWPYNNNNIFIHTFTITL